MLNVYSTSVDILFSLHSDLHPCPAFLFHHSNPHPHPQHLSYLISYIPLFSTAGNWSESLPYIQSSIDIDPQYRYAFGYRGLLKHGLGWPVQALDDLRAARDTSKNVDPVVGSLSGVCYSCLGENTRRRVAPLFIIFLIYFIYNNNLIILFSTLKRKNLILIFFHFYYCLYYHNL